MKFRLHRGSLAESLDTVREVKSLQDVQDYVRENDPFPCTNLRCRYYMYDDRIDWDTWIITSDQGVIGFSNGELKD